MTMPASAVNGNGSGHHNSHEDGSRHDIGNGNGHQDHITEDEASLYDRQIRLWGLEAQNRMRNSTVLILSLRSLAHETIKNLVLAGIGRMIVMDGGSVIEEDLGAGFLFREEEGAVGKERTEAALPQIASLNPLVSLTALPTLAPFIRDPQSAGALVSSEAEIVDFLHREKVDVVVGCDLPIADAERIDAATREANAMFYAAGTYGFYGYVFADLGQSYDYLYTPPTTSDKAVQKQVLSYAPMRSVLDRSEWQLSHEHSGRGGSPFRGLTRSTTKERAPGPSLGLLAVWEFEKRHQRLPAGLEDQAELSEIADQLRVDLGVNPKAMRVVDPEMISHLAQHAHHFFPPTLAVLGGLLAQDVLRALSRKDKPIVNLLCVDSMGGVGVTARWNMEDAVDAAEASA